MRKDSFMEDIMKTIQETSWPPKKHLFVVILFVNDPYKTPQTTETGHLSEGMIYGRALSEL